jgi:hypothetical protein
MNKNTPIKLTVAIGDKRLDAFMENTDEESIKELIDLLCLEILEKDQGSQESDNLQHQSKNIDQKGT